MFDATPDASSFAGAELALDSVPDRDAAPIERREKRTPTNLIGAIRLPDGTEFPCIVKDVSPSGARLGVPGSRVLPERFMFKMNSRDLVFQARLAWRKDAYAGVRIERIAKLPTGKRPA